MKRSVAKVVRNVNLGGYFKEFLGSMGDPLTIFAFFKGC